MIAVIPPVAVLLYPVEVKQPEHRSNLMIWNARVRQFNKGKLR